MERVFPASIARNMVTSKFVFSDKPVRTKSSPACNASRILTDCSGYAWALWSLRSATNRFLKNQPYPAKPDKNQPLQIQMNPSSRGFSRDLLAKDSRPILQCLPEKPNRKLPKRPSEKPFSHRMKSFDPKCSGHPSFHPLPFGKSPAMLQALRLWTPYHKFRKACPG